MSRSLIVQGLKRYFGVFLDMQRGWSYYSLSKNLRFFGVFFFFWGGGRGEIKNIVSNLHEKTNSIFDNHQSKVLKFIHRSCLQVHNYERICGEGEGFHGRFGSGKMSSILGFSLRHWDKNLSNVVLALSRTLT